VDGEDEADARRLIRGRGIDDRWRRIDRFPVVVSTGGHIPTAVLIPAAIAIPVASIAIPAERWRNGYTADH
jgi:3-mercaptopyruvate sulfurtransferase SseA